MRLEPEVLLCDADGTLFPSEEPAFVASADVTNELLAALGVDARYGAEELRLATTGKNFRTTAVDLATAHGVPALARPSGSGAVRERGLTQELLQWWVEEERERVSAHLAAVLRPDPGVSAPLQRLGRRHRLAAVSSSALRRLAACFTATGLDALIVPERRFSAEDSLSAPTSKPDPAVYLHACRELEVAPGRCLAVEDSVPGALSAVSAGIPTLGIVQFVPPSEREQREQDLRAAGASHVVSSWEALEQFLAGGVP